MAYVNVSEWTPEHVAEWLRGLEGCILPYVNFFLNNDIDGTHLLNLTPEDLNALHIVKIGHQELILEAVDLLRQLHYGLTLETLQYLALQLGCKSRSLRNDLKINGPQDDLEGCKQERVSTDTLSAVSDILVSVKSLVSWLDRYPFQYQEQYIKVKKAILKLSIELASTAQRDQFVERPHQLIKISSLELADHCDKIVQEFNDSLIIQPASLDIATIKKKPDEELGMHIQSTYSGVHIISAIKLQSPATRCAKVEEGDEIVQVNYQTVTGWHLKSFLEAMKEHPMEIHLTLKKRPRHTNILGQIIILRPYRIPSKKSAFGKVHKWSEGSSSLHIQEVYSTSNESESSRTKATDDEDDDSAFLPDTAVGCDNIVETKFSYRMFPYSSHATVQRRATVSGASPTVLKAPINIEDLVNGVPIIVKKDNIGRSISHDPSKLSIPGKNYSTAKSLDDIKSEDMEEFIEKTIETCTDTENARSDTTSDIQPMVDTKTNQSAISFSSNVCMSSNHGKKSPISPDGITAQEEECIVLENKSLEEMKERSAESKSLLPPSQKSVLCTWAGADTAFCGRHPNAMEISDIVAGNGSLDSNPVLLRRISKLNASSEDTSKPPKSPDFDSYQVMVVGGVPQRSPVTTTEEKRSFENMLRRKIAGKSGTRRISCKELGISDCQGWLYKQREKKGFFPLASQWTKRWIILKSHYLFSYKDRNDEKAECLLFLPGSTVSPAIGCKTKKYCFNVCQMNVAFYFATESQSDLSKWMNKIGLAAIAYDASSNISTSGFLRPEVLLCVENTFYSETDDSDDSYCLDKRPGYAEMLKRPLNFQSCSSSIPQQFQRKVDRACSVNDLKTKFLKSDSKDHYYLRSGHQYQPNSQTPKNNMYCSTNYSTQDPQSNLNAITTNLKSHKISYNRSFSHTDSSNSYLRDQNLNCFGRKLSCGETNTDQFHVYDVPTVGLESTPSKLATNDDYDILTLSLGRQKPITKEITPGLVARMAISYSNLSLKNAVAKSAGKVSVFKGVPSPGYVAKISDSFDHLAKDKSADIYKCHNVIKSKIIEKHIDSVPGNFVKMPCQRSASESHVALSNLNSSHNAPIHNISYLQHTGNAKSKAEKLTSRLDRDHYRLYGRRKISPSSIQSPSPENSTVPSEATERMMRFFPADETNVKKSINNTSHSKMSRVSNSTLMIDRNSTAKNQSSSGRIDATKDICDAAYAINVKKSLPDNFQSSHKRSSNYQKQISHKVASAGLSQDLCQGIENVGFYSPEQENQYSLEKCGTNLSTHVKSLSVKIEDQYQQSTRIGSLFNYSKSEIEQSLPPKSATTDSPVSKSFKFFGSPKFMKKLTSPKLDKRNIFKSKKQAKDIKKAEQSDVNINTERKLFGSPRLAQAIFGSPKVTRENMSATSIESLRNTPVSGKYDNSNVRNRFFPNDELDVQNISVPDKTVLSNYKSELVYNELNKSNSNSSLNSDASSSILSASTSSSYYVGNRSKPQVSIMLPLSTEKCEERVITPETPRTPLKPTMGVAMLGKRRLPSLSGESSISLSSSRSSHEEPANEQLSFHSESKIDQSEQSEQSN